MAKSKKLPALQFYPGDWRKSMDVQSLSFHDRGVWFEMLMVMHDSERRGVLVLNGRAMDDDAIARCIGLDNQTFNQSLTTLLTSGVAEREQATGAVMSRRMVRDENLRQIRTEAGSMGGNPALVNQKQTSRDKQKLTPSSSSSVSTTEQKQKPSRKRGDKKVDPRHTLFMKEIQRYMEAKKSPFIWNVSEAKHLSELLAAVPDLTFEVFQRCLLHRAQSKGVPHGERPRMWISNILKYQEKPLNVYGKTEDANGSDRKLDRDERNEANAKAALDSLERDFGSSAVYGISTTGNGHGSNLHDIFAKSLQLPGGGSDRSHPVTVIEGEAGRRDGLSELGDDHRGDSDSHG